MNFDCVDGACLSTALLNNRLNALNLSSRSSKTSRINQGLTARQDTADIAFYGGFLQ